mmetsp:Transcript_54536/g.173293  ORF Transcript_54536/g.173293 Transcript_54536/m.173293 type:complete len:515 (+) Transcript_54536:89-1633(+)
MFLSAPMDDGDHHARGVGLLALALRAHVSRRHAAHRVLPQRPRHEPRLPHVFGDLPAMATAALMPPAVQLAVLRNDYGHQASAHYLRHGLVPVLLPFGGHPVHLGRPLGGIPRPPHLPVLVAAPSEHLAALRDCARVGGPARQPRHPVVFGRPHPARHAPHVLRRHLTRRLVLGSDRVVPPELPPVVVAPREHKPVSRHHRGEHVPAGHLDDMLAVHLGAHVHYDAHGLESIVVQGLPRFAVLVAELGVPAAPPGVYGATLGQRRAVIRPARDAVDDLPREGCDLAGLCAVLLVTEPEASVLAAAPREDLAPRGEGEGVVAAARHLAHEHLLQPRDALGLLEVVRAAPLPQHLGPGVAVHVVHPAPHAPVLHHGQHVRAPERQLAHLVRGHRRGELLDDGLEFPGNRIAPPPLKPACSLCAPGGTHGHSHHGPGKLRRLGAQEALRAGIAGARRAPPRGVLGGRAPRPRATPRGHVGAELLDAPEILARSPECSLGGGEDGLLQHLRDRRAVRR